MLAALLCSTLAMACGDDGPVATDLTIERLPDVEASLPAVPTLPPPPHPTQYADNSYSVFGLRHRIRNTIDTDVEVTGYIVEIYQPPPCDDPDNCPPALTPHMWVADTTQEEDRLKRLTIVGYAENHAQIEEAVENAQRGRVQEVLDGQLPIPTDFAVGAKIKLHGRFARVAGIGFNMSEGLLEYRSHEIVEPPPGGEGS